MGDPPDPATSGTGGNQGTSSSSTSKSGNISGAGGNTNKPTMAQIMKKPTVERTTKSPKNFGTLLSKFTLRTYKLVSKPNLGFQFIMKKKFKSLHICTLGKYKLDGHFIPTLTLGFDTSHADYSKEYSAAREFSYNQQGPGGTEKVVTLKCLESSETDSKGTYYPRIAKSLVVSDVPPSNVACLDLLKEDLDKFVEFTTDEPKMLYEDGIFTGKVSFSIKKFKNAHHGNVDVSAVQYNISTLKFERDPKAKVEVFITPIGFDLDDSSIKKKYCNICRDIADHTTASCPKLKERRQTTKGKKKGFLCKICGGNDVTKCEERHKKLANGIIPAANKPKADSKKKATTKKKSSSKLSKVDKSKGKSNDTKSRSNGLPITVSDRRKNRRSVNFKNDEEARMSREKFEDEDIDDHFSIEQASILNSRPSMNKLKRKTPHSNQSTSVVSTSSGEEEENEDENDEHDMNLDVDPVKKGSGSGDDSNMNDDNNAGEGVSHQNENISNLN